MPLLFTDPCFLAHDTGSHPETSKRLQVVTEHLAKNKPLLDRFEKGSIASASRDVLQRVHSGKYVDRVQAFASRGGGRIESDTVVSPKSFEVALQAAGTACEAVDQVLGGKHKTAMCLIRPPGHHALAADAMGFCLFNNVAVAARHAIAKHGLSQIANYP